MHLGSRTALDEALDSSCGIEVEKMEKILRAYGELLLNFLHFIQTYFPLGLSVIFNPVETLLYIAYEILT